MYRPVARAPEPDGWDIKDTQREGLRHREEKHVAERRFCYMLPQPFTITHGPIPTRLAKRGKTEHRGRHADVADYYETSQYASFSHTLREVHTLSRPGG